MTSDLDTAVKVALVCTVRLYSLCSIRMLKVYKATDSTAASVYCKCVVQSDNVLTDSKRIACYAVGTELSLLMPSS
jgi:hypothetical protein